MFAGETLLSSPYKRLLIRAPADLHAAIARRISSADNAWILDVACGPGFLDLDISALNPGVFVTGVDENAGHVRFANRLKNQRKVANCSFARGNASRLPFGAASFEVTLSASAVSFWPDPERVIHEMRRVLVQDGVACLVEVDAGYSEEELKNLAAATHPTSRSVSAHLAERGVRKAVLEEAVSPPELVGFARSAGFERLSIIKVRAGLPIFMLRLQK